MSKFILIPEGFNVYGATQEFDGTLEEAQDHAIDLASKMKQLIWNPADSENVPVRRIIIGKIAAEIVPVWKAISKSLG